MLAEEPAQIGLIREIAQQGNFGYRKMGIVEPHLDFDGQLFVNQLFGRLAVHVGGYDFIQVAGSNTQFVGIKPHLMLTHGILVQQAEELLTQQLFPGKSTVRQPLLRQ